MRRILVTGGAGYIGSHTCLELLLAGFQVTVLDNLSNSKMEAIHRVERLAGKSLGFYQVDLRDTVGLQALFQQEHIDAVIHFAGLKAVGESVELPLRYYHNNVTGTLNLLEAMRQHGVFQMVFSSSATVYGNPDSVPVTEEAPLRVTNPYGRTKLVIEDILRDAAAADSAWHFSLLRYFNPVGAHPSGLIGEDPAGIPSNLFPYITQVAVGRLARLHVFGGDYPTHDGAGVRDYIHVVDVAVGHLRALEILESAPGAAAFNLGTGVGYSVLDVISAFEEVAGREIPYSIVERRAGDVPAIYADPSLAESVLGWCAERTLTDMCRDAWRWQSENPQGYDE